MPFLPPNQQRQNTEGKRQRYKVKQAAHTRLPSIGFRSWSRFLAVSLQVAWVINPTVGCHYFPPGLQLHPQPFSGLLLILLLGEQRHDKCEQFAWDCYPTASRLRFEPGLFCAWVQQANHSSGPNTMVKGHITAELPTWICSPKSLLIHWQQKRAKGYLE